MVTISMIIAMLAPWSAVGQGMSWNGQNVNDLHAEYHNIFKYGNRNAASHLWAKFLLDRSVQMTAQKFTYMFSGFCPVSGSPISPMDRTRYRLTLGKVGGGTSTGLMYYCCSPCICDTMDFIKVDTKSVTLKDGQVQQFNFSVIGNPCKKPEVLTTPYQDAFGGGMTTLERQAPEVRCDKNGHLEGAYVSDGGYIIIGMFFNEDPSLTSQDSGDYQSYCASRAVSGYASGMGKIFRKVAGIAPVNVTTPVGMNAKTIVNSGAGHQGHKHNHNGSSSDNGANSDNLVPGKSATASSNANAPFDLEISLIFGMVLLHGFFLA